jgi:hypothetical protein
MLGVSFMVGEPTFYEAADDRMDRFRALMRASLREDPVWTARFVGALRSVFNIRTASVVAAAEFALALREMRGTHGSQLAQLTEAGVSVRSVVDSALQRADEPAEFVAYWKLRTGKATLPGGVQRGLADAVQRLYREFTAIKYDGTASGVRMGDVLEVAHPGNKGPWQADLWEYLLDRRHHADAIQIPLQRLPMIETNRAWRSITDRDVKSSMVRGLLSSGRLADQLKAAGMTWEEFGSWLGRPLTAAEWEALIPSMGYMALLRHLRQFDEVGLSDEAAGRVAARLADPTEVARSRQFPYRFLTAYRQVPSDRWGTTLERALQASCSNLPTLDGRTLVAVDTSGSMRTPISGRSVVSHVEVGALFAVALAVKAQAAGGSVDLRGFADAVFTHKIPRGASVLRQIDAFTRRIGEVGHGTNVPLALAQHTDHKRVVIFSDMQTLAQFGSGRAATLPIPAEVPVISFNTGGYGNTLIRPDATNRIELAGFTDAAFRLLAIMEAGPEGMAELVAPREIEDGEAQ